MGIEIDEWEYTLKDDIVCPYCGKEQSYAYKVNTNGYFHCEQCEKSFYVTCLINISYTSKKE